MSQDTYDYLVKVGLSDDAIAQLAHEGVRNLRDLRGRTLIDSTSIDNPSVARSRMLPDDLRKQDIRQVLLKPLMEY